MNRISSIKRKPLIDQSIEELKKCIMEGDLQTGDFLPPEMELCKLLGIGRSTVREAIKSLELQGFVRKKHGVGIIIVNESDIAAKDMLQLMLKRNGSTMSELMDMRYVIEQRTAELAALNATTYDCENIKSYLDIMQEKITTKSEYIKADIGFHLAIARASHNLIYQFILQAIRPLIEEMIQKTLKFNQRPEQNKKYHQKIYDGIRQKNSELALIAIKQHLQATRDMLNI
jgi:GntR family transcriptional repressor for pyruvate dehydrogenase complex